MVVYAPLASQVYQRNVEPANMSRLECRWVTLIDLNDLWIHFDLREDLVKTLKVGDRFDVRIRRSPTAASPSSQADCTKGEYASLALPPAPPAISTSALSRSAPIRSTRCRSCGPA